MSAWDLDGELRCSMDEKGRVIIPKSFREPFEGGLHVIRGLTGKCLWLFPLDEWPAQRALLVAHMTAGTGAADAVRFLRSGFAETPDRQGRVMIPPPLRIHADLKPNASVAAIGMGGRLELWNADFWQQRAVDVIDQVADIMVAADLAAMRGEAEPAP